MQKLAALAALVMAGGFLALQLLAAYEFTQGGSLYTQAAAMGAMVGIFALPVFAEAALRAGYRGAMLAIVIGFLGLLVYSLPATTGRTGEIKAEKVTAAADVGRMRDDLERTSRTLEWSRQDWITECGSGEGKKCRAKRNTVQALEDRVAKLTADLKASRHDANGDVASDIWAWALAPLGVSADAIRKITVIAFAVGIDVTIFGLMWFVSSALFFPLRKPVNDNRPSATDTMQTSFPDPLPPARMIEPEIKGGNVIAWAREFEKRHSRKPRLDEAEQAFKGQPISRSTIYRRLRAA